MSFNPSFFSTQGKEVHIIARAAVYEGRVQAAVPRPRAAQPARTRWAHHRYL